MKYAKHLSRVVSLLALTALFGCAQLSEMGEAATANTKQSKLVPAEAAAENKAAQEPVVTVELKPTEQFIPRLVDDGEGGYLPYEASKNPYLLQEGVISKSSVAIFITARRAYKAGEYDKAIASLSEITARDSTLAGPWVMLANIYNKQGKYADAESRYKRALLINPLNVNAYIGLAYVQRVQGKYKLAQNTYFDALQLWKDFPEAHLNLAILYDIYLNKPVLAQKHLETYQLLTEYKNDTVAQWHAELQKRTGAQTLFTEKNSSLLKVDLADTRGLVK